MALRQRLVVVLLTATAALVAVPAAAASPTQRKAAAWTVQAAPQPTLPNGSLLAVACPNAKTCIAVGSALNLHQQEAILAESWNGSSWKLTPTPTPAGAASSGLSGVACISGDDCWAVGGYTNAKGMGFTLAELWNGKVWNCTAVGGTANRTATLDETLTGTVWSVQTTPNPPGGTSNNLTGVACPTAAACMAVGDDGDPAGATVTLSETWGTKGWAIRPSADATGSTTSGLGAVSCSSATACTAVGAYDHLVLSETWDGHTWTIRHNPVVPGQPGDDLYGVACRSASQCMAVGAAHLVLTNQGLSESWNGASWTIQHVPLPPGATTSLLGAVACPAVKFCEAVGTFQNAAGVEETWAESWNGTSWSLQSTPDPAGAEESGLDAVACTSAVSCVAVGAFLNSSFDSEPASQVWNGTAWKLLTTPGPTGSSDTSLNSVSCSGTTCMAVGDSTNKSFASLGITEQLVGTHWTIKAPATPAGASDVTLNGVDCTSAKQCTAVGNYVNRTFAAVPLGEQWTGSKWVLAPMPSPAGSISNVVNAVSCTSSTACTAVGATGNDTLTERYTG